MIKNSLTYEQIRKERREIYSTNQTFGIKAKICLVIELLIVNLS